MAKTITHTDYVQAIKRLVLKRKSLTTADRDAIMRAYITYGAHTESGMRGVTWHEKWDHACNAAGKRIKGRKPQVGAFICMHGSGQVDLCALAGTTVHELAHAAAGPAAGHLVAWKEACGRLGLTRALVGMPYSWDLFDPALAKAIKALPIPNDGMPRHWRKVVEELRAKGGEGLPPGLQSGPLEEPKLRPCGAGWGIRGGKSRGKGSGSRSLKYTCTHTGDKCADQPTIIRLASTKLDSVCKRCAAPWVLDDGSLPPSHKMGQSGQGVPAKTAREAGARKPLKPRPAKPARGKGAKAGAKAARLNAEPAKPRATPKRRRMATVQAANAPIPKVEPQAAAEAALALLREAGKLPPPMGENGEFVKPEARWCEGCNTPSTMCTKPAGECEA